MLTSPAVEAPTIQFAEDPTCCLALYISGGLPWGQYVFYECLPYLLAVMLGVSLSLTGLLLPISLPPIAEHSRALDIAFNNAARLYMNDYEWY